jgi:2-dehydro-3-deoxyphosphooctonate aldolase (KDO 8-P synthase)
MDKNESNSFFKDVNIDKNISFNNKNPFVLIAGPCVLESKEHAFSMVDSLKNITQKLNIPFIYKTSFDKANRTSLSGNRGLGLNESLQIFADIKSKFNVKIITDVHESHQCEQVKEVVDIIQIPAFLCRQTDLLLAAGKTNLPINIKKAQFLSPYDMFHVVKKIESTGNNKILLCERGNIFGYQNLIVDMTSFEIMKKTGYPVIFDATHSVQKIAGINEKSGGNRDFVPILAKSAIAQGISGLFLEVHEDPDSAPSDGANMLKLKDLESLLSKLIAIDKLVKSFS